MATILATSRPDVNRSSWTNRPGRGCGDGKDRPALSGASWLLRGAVSLAWQSMPVAQPVVSMDPGEIACLGFLVFLVTVYFERGLEAASRLLSG